MTPKQARRAHKGAEEEKKLELGKCLGVYCYRCRNEGHYAFQCLKKSKNGTKKAREDVTCFKCRQVGHFVDKCPKVKNSLKKLRMEKRCFRCKEIGHIVQKCHLKKGEQPVRERTKPSVTIDGQVWTIQNICAKCFETGHSREDCPKRNRCADTSSEEEESFTAKDMQETDNDEVSEMIKTGFLED